MHSWQARGLDLVLRALGSHGRLGGGEGQACALTRPSEVDWRGQDWRPGWKLQQGVGGSLGWGEEDMETEGDKE